VSSSSTDFETLKLASSISFQVLVCLKTLQQLPVVYEETLAALVTTLESAGKRPSAKSDKLASHRSVVSVEGSLVLSILS